jgi:hypothetical protein
MNDTTLLLVQGLIGQVLPPLTDLINKWVPSARLRFLSSMIISAVIGLVFTFHKLQFGNIDQFLLSSLVVWASSQAAYKFYYGGSLWQANIRFDNSPLPLTKLIPPISGTK